LAPFPAHIPLVPSFPVSCWPVHRGVKNCQTPSSDSPLLFLAVLARPRHPPPHSWGSKPQPPAVFCRPRFSMKPQFCSSPSTVFFSDGLRLTLSKFFTMNSCQVPRHPTPTPCPVFFPPLPPCSPRCLCFNNFYRPFNVFLSPLFDPPPVKIDGIFSSA